MTAAAGMPNSGQGSSSLPFNMTSTDAAKALEKELGNSGSDFSKISGSPAIAQPGSSAVEDSAFVVEAPAVASITEEQIAESMSQDLYYGQSDIGKSDSNIFEIVSNRYQRSGMRRLFKEEVKAETNK